MTTRKTAAIILAAGKGTRMKSSLPKVLHPVGHRAMIDHVLAAVDTLSADRTTVVLAPGMTPVAEAVKPAAVAIQDPPLGTAHAVLAARETLEDFEGDVLVLFGDTPLITSDTLAAMIDRRRESDDPAVVVLGFRPEDTAAYGRLIVDDQGHLEAIVEHRDATEDQRAIRLCNGGVMAIDGKAALGLLDAVGNDNAKSEYYLTDIIALARSEGRVCAVVEGDAAEVMGVDSRAGLARAEAVFQARARTAVMEAGATLLDPDTVYFSADTAIGRDVTIGPNVVFGPGVTLEDQVTIHAFSHIEGAHVGTAATIGPFARLRPGADIGEEVRVGNFVEVKKARVEKGAKINHLSYVGDARVGAEANIGAGTITCNYDGFNKHVTDIGAGAFIGSNSALIAPVKVGDGAIVGAGSAITTDVPEDALSVTRAPQRNIAGWAQKFRNRHVKKD